MLREKVEQGEEAWDFKEGSQMEPTEKVILSQDSKDVMRESRGHLWKECSRRRVFQAEDTAWQRLGLGRPRCSSTAKRQQLLGCGAGRQETSEAASQGSRGVGGRSGGGQMIGVP